MRKIDIVLRSKHSNRKFAADAQWIENGTPKPVVIFNHGFKGFKDWGPFDLVSKKFAAAGFIFIKMNFSHNGTTLERPNDFVDLEAFAQNNFSIELDDSGVLIDHLFSEDSPLTKKEADLSRLYIVGHSRGGAHVILKANEDKRVKKVVTWAAVSNLESWHSREQIDQWEKAGRIFIYNSRTQQEMPLDFQLVKNFKANRNRLQVPEAVKNMSIPMLSIHGTNDPTVPMAALNQIASWNSKVQTVVINGAGHTFGGTHPFEGEQLPDDLSKVSDLTIDFLKMQ
jgi:pimeloyl-ACP methyl ester carboxylesterase